MRNQILNLKMVTEKNREHNNDLFLCFIDYSCYDGWFSMRERECELKYKHALTMCIHLISSYYEPIVRWLDRTLSQETM